MSGFSNWITALSYAIFSAALGLAAQHFLALSWELTATAGVMSFLICSQAHGALNRYFEGRIVERELDYLQRGNLLLGEEIETLREETELRTGEVERQAEVRSQKVTAEVRLLETLISQMADGLEKKAREAALAALDEAEQASASGEDDGAVSKLINTLEIALNDAEINSSRNGQGGGDEVDGLSEAELLEVIRASLRENRVDLYLQPIVSLPDREVMFYEALTRLRSHSGEMIYPAQYLSVAEPAGLMSIIDNLLLFRCVQMVRRITATNASVSIVCNMSLSSILDGEFFPHFVEFMELNSDLSSSLIFEFSQATVEACGENESASLVRLSEQGFRFSIDGVMSLEIDLPDLRQRNFRFVKVRADHFLNALNDEDDKTEAMEFQELLGRFGIDLIVERVETEGQAEDITQRDIRFAQGFLFGEPRPLEEVEARINATVETDSFGEEPRKLAYHG